MEACATAHYWARAIAALGHEVRLMPPQYVKAYVKRNKNDAADAEAICEAVCRPSMRFVPVKSAEQQARSDDASGKGDADPAADDAGQCAAGPSGGVRDRRRPGYPSRRRSASPSSADEADTRVPAIARPVLRVVADQIAVVQNGIEGIDARIVLWHRSSEVSQRLAGIPGVGPIVASAVAASVADASVFRCWQRVRRLARAWYRGRSGTGGKTWLGRISRRGDGYVRRLLVTGAMTALTRSRPDRCWSRA